MKDKLDDMAPDVRDRLTTLLIQGGHLSHPLRLRAHVETDATKEDLVAALGDALPDYMVPEQIYISAALPRLPNGKLDRAAVLRAQLQEDAPVQETPPSTAPQSETLETLREIWAEVLGTDQIFDDDNFFEMGGDSLLSISVVSRARKAGLDLVPSDLFDYQSLSELALRIGTDTPAQPLSTVDSGPLSMSSQGDDDATTPIFLLNASRKMLDSLNAHLTPSRTLHLLTMHWDSGAVDDVNSIEVLAQEYLQSIRSIQPEGPYAIGGFSIGAVAAFEIAHQLTQQNIGVTDLILIDPPENPDLFASPHNSNHQFSAADGEKLTFLRKARFEAAIFTSRFYRLLKISLPDKLKRYYTAAVYFKAAKLYHIDKPARPVTIVRRKSESGTSMWANPDELHDLQEIICEHEEFHRDPATIDKWTELLAKSLRPDRPGLH